jgi:hypothetical protein
VVDLVTESDASDDEVEILEPPPIPVLDLVTDNEDEVAPPSTPPLGDIVPMITNKDSKSEVELLREIGSVNLSWEESREAAKTMSGKVIMAWGKVCRIARRTKSEMRVSPERPSRELENFGYLNSRDVDFTKRIGGFYEPSLSPDRHDFWILEFPFIFLNFVFRVEKLYEKLYFTYKFFIFILLE